MKGLAFLMAIQSIQDAKLKRRPKQQKHSHRKGKNKK